MEQKIRATMAQTGMEYVQAYYHVKGREAIARVKRQLASSNWIK